MCTSQYCLSGESKMNLLVADHRSVTRAVSEVLFGDMQLLAAHWCHVLALGYRQSRAALFF